MFSDRSVLLHGAAAAGPQGATGVGEFVPTGRGVLDFCDKHEAQAAVAGDPIADGCGLGTSIGVVN